MFIQPDPTPNPATLKFLPGQVVMAQGTADFTDPASAERSPLAQALFAIEGVRGVFLGTDFVTVTRDPGVEWQVLKPAILGVIMEHLTSGRPIILDAPAAAGSEEDDDPVVAQIKELIETRVRPAVAQDGGDI